MKLGQTIVEIRKTNNLTQENFAEIFNVTRQTVSNWENERSYPDLLTLIKISDTYGYSLDSMLKENPDMTEAMNKSINMVNEIREKSKKDYIFSLLGCGCGAILLLGSLFESEKNMLEYVFIAVIILVNAYMLVTNLLKSRKVQEPIENQFNKLTDADLELIRQLISRDMHVEAVKMVRKVTGVGLYEADVFVKGLEEEQKTDNV